MSYDQKRVVDAIRAFGSDLPVLLLPGSVALAKAGGSGTTKRRFYRADD